MQKHVVKALNNICQGRVSIFRESILNISYPLNNISIQILSRFKKILILQ